MNRNKLDTLVTIVFYTVMGLSIGTVIAMAFFGE